MVSSSQCLLSREFWRRDTSFEEAGRRVGRENLEAMKLDYHEALVGC